MRPQDRRACDSDFRCRCRRTAHVELEEVLRDSHYAMLTPWEKPHYARMKFVEYRSELPHYFLSEVVVHYKFDVPLAWLARETRETVWTRVYCMVILLFCFLGFAAYDPDAVRERSSFTPRRGKKRFFSFFSEYGSAIVRPS